MGLTYCNTQQSDEKIKLVKAHQGITQATADDSSKENMAMDMEKDTGQT